LEASSPLSSSVLLPPPAVDFLVSAPVALAPPTPAAELPKASPGRTTGTAPELPPATELSPVVPVCPPEVVVASLSAVAVESPAPAVEFANRSTGPATGAFAVAPDSTLSWPRV
jgi:hypothetical protein